MGARFPYRVWQFWQSFRGTLDPGFNQEADGYLNQDQQDKFFQLPVSDQNHCFRVFINLVRAGESNKDLLQAALLHDLGKVKYPLNRWERVAAVLTDTLLPGLANRWAAGQPQGFRKALVVYHQHSDWGARLAEELGCSPLTVWLIRNHETIKPLHSPVNGAGEMLRKLQNADNQN